MSRIIKSTQCIIENAPCAVDIDKAIENLPPPEIEKEDEINQEELRTEIAREKEEILGKARQEVATMKEKATQEVDKIKAAAQKEALAIKEKAAVEGREAGYQEGLATAKNEQLTNLTGAIELVGETQTSLAERLAASEAELLRLALAIAEKIVETELQTKPAQIVAIVRQALKKVETASKVQIRINPEELAFLEESQAALNATFSLPKQISLLADPAIDKGGCFIDTECGQVDARLQSRLELLTQELLKVGKN